MTTSTPRQELTITIAARFDGFTTEICFSGLIDQLPAVTKRIRELGGEPIAPHSAPLNGSQPKAERVDPSYNDAGEACCPVHKRRLSEGQYGLFCSAKAKDGQAADKKGYCGLKFND